MAKPTNTIGDRDYGRRTYASKKKYEDQRKLASDANIDRTIGKQRHSEYKKPYIPDQSYPEMEMYNIPWTPPVWPKPPPDDPVVVIPGEPGGPIPPVRPTPPRELPPFLGCMFFSRRIRPTTLQPGQMAFGGIDFGNEDYISSIKIFGPGILLSTFAACNKKEAYQISGYKPQKSGTGFCTIIVKAKDDPKDFVHVTEYFTIGKDAPGPYPIIVEVKMQSGAVCTEMIEVETCPADPPLEWDEMVSATTISRGGSAIVAVKGGLPPYTWSLIGGTGVSIRQAGVITNTNTIDANYSACGAAQLKVVDSCGDEAFGDVRVLEASSWQLINPYSCVAPGPPTSYIPTGGYPDYGTWVSQIGRYKCHDGINHRYSDGVNPCSEDPDQRRDCNRIINGVWTSCTFLCLDCRDAGSGYGSDPCGQCVTGVHELLAANIGYCYQAPFCLSTHLAANSDACGNCSTGVGGLSAIMCFCRGSGTGCYEWKCT